MHERRADLAVIGAGIMGLAHAWHAHRAGLEVLVVDRDESAVGAGIRTSDRFAPPLRTAACWTSSAPPARAGSPSGATPGSSSQKELGVTTPLVSHDVPVAVQHRVATRFSTGDAVHGAFAGRAMAVGGL